MTSHWRCQPFYKKKNSKNKKKEKKAKKKKKSFENVQIKSDILINLLHVLLNILITWMFTLCMIVAEYFATNDAQNMYNMVIHNRLL